MAAPSRRREVALSAASLETLREIWHWNAARFGQPRADGYLRFLQNAIESLARPETAGRPVAGRHDLRYLLIRRRAGGHGHVAVFRAVENRVTVLQLFHTAQDWHSALAADAPSQ